MGVMTRLLLLLWAGVTVGSVVDLQKRIIGGKPCPKDERGYHAYLTINDKPFCGGSLIHKQWILTAAHCWEDGRNIKAVLGPHTDHPTPVEIELTPRIYPDTDKRSNTKKHDIMLLKLKKPTTILPVPRPVSIDCAKKPNNGETVQIAGFYFSAKPGDNKTLHRVDASKPLQCADIKVVDCDASSKCQAVNYPYTHSFKQLLCYEDKNKKVDASGGDSGGGVVFNKMIYGVHVSSGEEACGGPAVAMDVCEDIYMDWISKTIDPKSSG